MRPIDQCALRAGLFGFQDQVRPEFAFAEDAEVRLPVPDEAAGNGRRVERGHEMNGAVRQGGAKQAGRGLGLAGEEEQQVRALFEQALAEFEQELALADAGPM